MLVLLLSAMSSSSVDYCSVPYCSVHCCLVPYYSVQYCSVPNCSTVQCNTIILFSAGRLLTQLSPVKTKMTNVLKGGKEVTRTDICK